MFGIRDTASKKYKLVNHLAESTLAQTNNDENTPTTDFSENTQPEKEWIWVRGYKGFNEQWVNSKLELTGRNSFIYSQDGETSIKEDEDENNLKECQVGLHFCPNLEDVFEFYSPIINRIFQGIYYTHKTIVSSYNTIFAEVEAEVEKDYYENNKLHNKLVARKIRIVKFLSNEEVFKHFNQVNLDCFNYFMELDEFNYIKNSLHEYTINNPKLEVNPLLLDKYYNDIYNKVIEKRKTVNINILIEHGYSPTFARIIMDKHEKAFDNAIAYADEGLSPDMRAYLIVNS